MKIIIVAIKERDAVPNTTVAAGRDETRDTTRATVCDTVSTAGGAATPGTCKTPAVVEVVALESTLPLDIIENENEVTSLCHEKPNTNNRISVPVVNVQRDDPAIFNLTTSDPLPQPAQSHLQGNSIFHNGNHLLI